MKKKIKLYLLKSLLSFNKKKIKLYLLRYLVGFNQKKLNKHLDNLSIEQRFVYKIAIRLLASSNSTLESSPTTGIFYAKNGLRLLKMDGQSLHFVNGKYSYYFSYNENLMKELMDIYYRHKEISIKHLVDEISRETTAHLENIYSELTKKD